MVSIYIHDEDLKKQSKIYRDNILFKLKTSISKLKLCADMSLLRKDNVEVL
ncbi:hypothetical protein PRLR5052_31890 [Prevotella lacticifex]|nr:hypothetical protein PRLR5052_31890 [Prevotella lacticifex]